MMATSRPTVYQNEFLPDGGDRRARDRHGRVHRRGRGRAAGSGDAAEIDHRRHLRLDGGPRTSAAVQAAAAAALDQILDGTWFAVVAGNHQALLAYPYDPQRLGDGADERRRPGPRRRRRWRRLRPDGGTAMGTWLDLAATLAVRHGADRDAAARDPADRRQEPARDARASSTRAIAAARGTFQCDCRGVGADWQVGRGAPDRQALLGTVDLIPRPDQMAEEFAALMRASMAVVSRAAELRVWAPQGAQVLFVRQVSPTVEDLTGAAQRGQPADRRVPDRLVGRRVARLPRGGPAAGPKAARPGAAGGAGAAGRRRRGRCRRVWSRRCGRTTTTLTTRINPEVAHYTGQAELAEAIQDGLAAKAAGDDRHGDREARPGRPARGRDRQRGGDRRSCARSSTSRTPATGTVRLKRSVDQARRDGARHGLDQDDPGEAVSAGTCPHGHPSQADDYCDICGAPIDGLGTCGGARCSRPCRLVVRDPGRGGTDGRGAVPELLAAEPARCAVLRGLRLRLHDGDAAATAVPATVAGRERGGSRRGGDLVGAGRAGRRRWSGWPRSGSTRTGTPSRSATEPCPSPGLPVSVPLTVRSLLVGRPSRSPEHPPGDRLRR